jgi:thioredoxin reductase (NADPH)
MNSLPTVPVDCLIVGAGPAGLVAATYLARYRREVCIVDSGNSRAARIPLSRNVPGFPRGVSGPRLLERIRQQAQAAGIVVCKGEVGALARDPAGFVASIGDAQVRAPTVLIATGCADHEPVPGLSRRGTWWGRVRWCPVCDGYESLDRRVVLIGDRASGAAHARFLRTYTRELALVIAPGESPLDPAEHGALERAGIEVVPEAPLRLVLPRGQPGRLELEGGRSLPFDVVYPMTGGRPYADLAKGLGARRAADGRLEVDLRQATSVPGLYAAGDVVASLGQVAVAMAEAAVAATAIHRSLPPNYR